MTCTADYRDIAIAGAELVVTVGIIEAALDTNEDVPEEVKENFSEKVDGVANSIHDLILEFQMFGEAFDRD